jgi:hypothetical protein
LKRRLLSKHINSLGTSKKLGHGSWQGSKSRRTVLARASSYLLELIRLPGVEKVKISLNYRLGLGWKLRNLCHREPLPDKCLVKDTEGHMYAAGQRIVKCVNQWNCYYM